jgi:hypothetical protein
VSDERQVKKPRARPNQPQSGEKKIGAKRAPEGRKKHNQEKTKELRFPIDEKCRVGSAGVFILPSDFFLLHSKIANRKSPIPHALVA